MCSFSDDDGWVYDDDNMASYDGYIGDIEDDIDSALEDVIIDQPDEPAPDIEIEETDEGTASENIEEA